MLEIRRFLAAMLIALAGFGSVAAPARAGDPTDATVARAALRQIEQSATLVRLELREARANQDRVGARCVSERLSEVHAQLRLANEHLTLLGNAATDRRHRFAIETARDRARELAREAQRCRQTDPRTRVVARNAGRPS